MNGFLLGIGQYKGYGLSFMTDVLTGVISGGGYGLIPYSNPKKLDVWHSITAIGRQLVSSVIGYFSLNLYTVLDIKFDCLSTSLYLLSKIAVTFLGLIS